jgi:hypothetical protein
MNSDVLAPSSSLSDALWNKVVNEGVEDRVEVNQRMLIDKMLARYSSDFVVYRELIQNSDDAQATSFELEITCDPSSATQSYEPSHKSEISNNPKAPKNILEGIGQLFGLNWVSSPTSSHIDQIGYPVSPSERSFDNCVITEIRTVNNGIPFNEDDWKRVITIAEGNTNAEAIGQFGVGFFSVFSYSERPMIQSGKYCLAFVWKNGKSLTTFRKELSNDEQSLNTSIILNMRHKYILQTKSRLEINEETKTNLRRPRKSKKNVDTHEIVPTMDLTQLKCYFTKVLSFTKYLNCLIIKINGLIVFQVNKIIKENPSGKSLFSLKRLNCN